MKRKFLLTYCLFFYLAAFLCANDAVGVSSSAFYMNARQSSYAAKNQQPYDSGVAENSKMAENTPAVEQHDNKMVRFERSQFNDDLESNINDNQDQVHVTQTATQQTNLDTSRKNRSDQSVISSADNNILTMPLSQFWYKKKHGLLKKQGKDDTKAVFLSSAQTGDDVKYQQKSVASIGEMLLLNGAEQYLDAKKMKQYLDPYLDLDRFAKNTLPNVLSDEFVTRFYNDADVSVSDIAQLLNDVYSPAISAILTDPSVQADRINQFKDNKQYTFEFTKGKSFSVTAEDLNKLFSSAFFYVPFVNNAYETIEHHSSVKDMVEKKHTKMTLEVEMGVLWYQLVITPDFQTKFVFIDMLTVQEKESEKYNEVEKKISLLNIVLDVLVEEKKTDDAVIRRRLAKDIVSAAGVDFEVLTKSLDPFKLVGRINQHHSNGYDISIDVNNGVFLDDFYYIMENYEKDGVDLARKRGILFVDRSTKNKNNHMSLLHGTQIYGKTKHLASWVKEAPKKGIQFNVNMGHRTGFLLDASDSSVIGTLFSNDVSSGLSLGAEVAVFGGALFNKSQYQLEIDGSIMLPDLNYTSSFDGDTMSVIYDVNVGLRKNLWVKQWSVQPYVRYGTHVFHAYLADDDEFIIEAWAMKFGVALEKMVYPFVLIGGSMYSTVTFGDSAISYNYLGREVEDIAGSSKFNWTGFNVYFKIIQ